jgi:hypothetical protein
MDHNPHLAVMRHPNDDKGSEAGIERPDAVVNIAWQTRPAPPSAFEDALADALQAIFADEIYDLPRILARLDAAGVAPPAGAARWDEASFGAELHRLGR